MKYLRKTKAGVELATVRMEYYRGHSITLMGVQHIAPKEFWERDIAELQRLEAAGAEILLEGVRPAEGELSEDEAARVAALKEFMSIQQVLADATGLTHQKEAFSAAGSPWTSYDVSILDVVRELKPGTIRRWQKLAELDREALRSSPRLALGLLRTLPLIPSFLSRALSGDLSKPIIEARNEFAVAGAVDSLEESVVLYWGAAHLPGMVKLLRAKGYRVAAVDWRLVLPASYAIPGSE